MCIYGLNSPLKCSFKNILGEKKFPCRIFLCMACMKWLLKCFYSKKLILPQKVTGCAPVTFNITFQTNFHSNIWVFANLPIYRKWIHNNIRLVFWKPNIFSLVLFCRRYEIVCTYKYLHWKLWLVLFWRTYVLFLFIFLFINIGIIIFVSVILKKKLMVIPIYLHCCKIPKGHSSNSSNISDYVNFVEIALTQHDTRIA